MRKTFQTPLLTMFVFLILGYLMDLGLNPYIQLTMLYVVINCILAMSLNLVNGTTGQFSLGHAGFMAVGSYTSAYFMLHYAPFPPAFAVGNFMVSTLLAGVLAGVFGYLVGQPSLRLKGDYLAIVTLGFGEIIRVALLNTDALGGPRGLNQIPGLPENGFFSRFLSSFLFGSFWMIICFFVLWRVIHSGKGRALMSVREDEIAAQSVGINTTRMKVEAFILSSFFAGVAGALFAHITRYISPSSFGFLKSIDVVIMVVLGGMGSLSGAIVAAVIVTFLPEVLRELQSFTGYDLRMVIYSLALILVMILRPQGLFGELELNEIWRKYVKRSA